MLTQHRASITIFNQATNFAYLSLGLGFDRSHEVVINR